MRVDVSRNAHKSVAGIIVGTGDNRIGEPVYGDISNVIVAKTTEVIADVKGPVAVVIIRWTSRISEPEGRGRPETLEVVVFVCRAYRISRYGTSCRVRIT